MSEMTDKDQADLAALGLTGEVKVFRMELDRSAFPDEETYQKAVASQQQLSRAVNVQGDDWSGIPDEHIVTVFQALVDHARPVGMGFLQPGAEDPFPLEKAQALWAELVGHAEKYEPEMLEVHTDYIVGRPIKTTFRHDSQTDTWSLNTRLYDRDQGNGSQIIRAALPDLLSASVENTN